MFGCKKAVKFDPLSAVGYLSALGVRRSIKVIRDGTHATLNRIPHFPGENTHVDEK
jgi:hypothetical protein